MSAYHRKVKNERATRTGDVAGVDGAVYSLDSRLPCKYRDAWKSQAHGSD